MIWSYQIYKVIGLCCLFIVEIGDYFGVVLQVGGGVGGVLGVCYGGGWFDGNFEG